MPDNRITLIVEGGDNDNGDVRLEVFLAELEQLHQALLKIDEKLSNGNHSSHFAIVGLSHKSPATVELEPRANPGRNDIGQQISHRLASVIDSVETGALQREDDYELLTELRGLATSIGTRLSAVTIKVDGKAFNLTPAFASKIEVHLAEQEVCHGTIEGMLERINVHNNANVFTIYPDIGATSVTCYFPKALVETALSAAKRRVSITGLLRYRKLAPFPHQVQADDIEIYDPDSALPDFDDLRGIAPSATGEESAPDFIARFRDGWV